MSNAQEVISEIYDFLDKYMLKNNTLTQQELIDFIELKWASADDEKYQIHDGDIIIGRMINEYIELKDVGGVKRWLAMSDKHASNKKNSDYIINYYRGSCLLASGTEDDALKCFQLCYDENKEYIFTRGKVEMDFFNQHLPVPVILPELINESEPFIDDINLPVWVDFFGEEAGELYYDLGGDDPKSRRSKNHKAGWQYIIDNQQAILSSILTELYKQYPTMQATYAYDGEQKRNSMPDITSPEAFANLLSPIAIHILSVHQNGHPYIGYEFSCSWDREHGLGVMMFKDRVIELAGADTSFLSWIARNDVKKQNGR